MDLCVHVCLFALHRDFVKYQRASISSDRFRFPAGIDEMKKDGGSGESDREATPANESSDFQGNSIFRADSAWPFAQFVEVRRFYISERIFVKFHHENS